MEQTLLQLAVAFYSETANFERCMEKLYFVLREKQIPKDLEEFLIESPQDLFVLVTLLDLDEFVFIAQQIKYNVLLEQLSSSLKHDIKQFNTYYRIVWADDHAIHITMDNKRKKPRFNTALCSALAMAYAESFIEQLIKTPLDEIREKNAFYFDANKYNELITVMEEFIKTKEDKKDYQNLLGYIKDLNPGKITVIDLKSQGGFDAGTTG
jgi:hypothetical protein